MKNTPYEPSMADILARAQTIGIQSTGNAEQDEAHLIDAARSDLMIENGYCPNRPCLGTQLAKVGHSHYECPVCKFALFRDSL